MGTPSGTLIFDVETHSRHLLYQMEPEEYVRLIGYKWADDSEVQITTDLEELRSAILSARWIIGHNVHDFDLRAVFGIRSDIPVQLAIEGRVYDTWTHAVLVNPAPFQYTDRFGKPALADSPEAMTKWFSLDEQAHQLGVAGKTADLKALAKEFGGPDLSLKDRIAGGFGRIPVDDPRYVSYLKGDVLASERVAKALLKLGPLNKYAMREQEIEARKAVISSNGLKLDRDRAQARVDKLAARREVIMRDLVSRYGLPDKGASPWATDPGKAAILAALADHGIRPDTVDWPKTPGWDNRDEKLAEAKAKIRKLRSEVSEWKAELREAKLRPVSLRARERWIVKNQEKIQGLQADPLGPAFGLSLSGETLIELTSGTPAEDLGSALAELKGQRSLAQLALDSVHPDGFVHPEITMLQRSGRWSTTEPGLTIWDNSHKDYFLPDSDEDVLLEFDYSNADARAVAAESGDERYAERFEPGADGHLINAWAAWGKDVVGTDKHDPVTAEYRQLAKPGGHGWGYRIGAKKLARTWGKSEEDAKAFLENMNKAFSRVVSWQEAMTRYARTNGHVLNDWGRIMVVDKGREFTQAPALIGQSTTREIICDALLKMPVHVLRRVKAQIHDALLMSVPRENWQECRDYVLGLMATSHEPGHGKGQRIEFPASAGPPGENWLEAKHD
ncbi:DNA polymerase [Amycolatopsis sp. NPDC059027]|uniref:DNA polymerase n=1 Tax=Amycolatopsis sp. NPDC059027 TaxID=3346709 RepID=UPI00366E2618